MEIKQFYDNHLAHGSYAIVSAGQMAVIDPARNPKPYEDFAKANKAKITTIFETHPHADFVSSHLELHKKYSATIYVNSKMGVDYPHQVLNHNETVKIGEVTVKALFTPGHSPDHNAYLLLDENGQGHAVFTGDSLFIGDVGRPDLREGAGNLTAKREELARQMFHTIHNVFKPLPDDITVYPAHGAGSLCGKNLSSDTVSSIGREKQINWAFQETDERKFIEMLLEGQPFVPKYFGYAVEMNRKGAPDFQISIDQVKYISGNADIKDDILVIDTSLQPVFRKAHRKHSINIPNTSTDKFETWLGAIASPDEKFYLLAEDENSLHDALRRATKIGYEQLIEGAGLRKDIHKNTHLEEIDLNAFRLNMEEYTLLDVRNNSELESGKTFENAIHIQLSDLREYAGELPVTNPIVTYCAGGYRSAVAASILKKYLGNQTRIFDLGKAIKEFNAANV